MNKGVVNRHFTFHFFPLSFEVFDTFDLQTSVTTIFVIDLFSSAMFVHGKRAFLYSAWHYIAITTCMYFVFARFFFH